MKHVKTSYHSKKMVLVNYDSSVLQLKDKVRFYYALKGRKGISGIMKLYNLEFLGKGSFLASKKFEDDLKMFFKAWKLPYCLREIILENREEVLKDE